MVMCENAVNDESTGLQMLNPGIFYLRLKSMRGAIGTIITNATTTADATALEFCRWAQLLLDPSYKGLGSSM